MSSRSVGIDFGTTTSLVAEGTVGRQPLVFPIGRSTSWLPSLVGLDQGGNLVTGDDAGDLEADRVRRSVKRCITRNESEIVFGNGTTIEADTAIAGVLSTIADNARSGIDLSPEATRLGCPAMWTGRQRQRLLDLADRAGLPVSDHTLIDEPVAAGVAWVSHQMTRSTRVLRGRLLVFDMGGGTLDVALLDVHAEPGQVPEISVLSSWGLDEAGDTLDRAIAADLLVQARSYGVEEDDLADDSTLLLNAATLAKIQLSTTSDTVVAVRGDSSQVPQLRYSREELEIVFQPQLKAAERLVWSVLKGARVTQEVQLSPQEIRALPKESLRRDVDFVLLAGGMSRVPAVAALMDQMFPDADLHLDAGVTPDEAIVAGLAETAAYDRINLHRPPFDFVLEHSTNAETVRVPVYNAYSPFYPPSFAATRCILYHEWRARPGEFPRTGSGSLQIRTAGGEHVKLDFEGEAQGWSFEIKFGHHPPAVLIYPNGRVLVIDGHGARSGFIVPRWPVIRGKDHAILKAMSDRENRAPVITDKRYDDPLFMH